jgi:hypothetical protein
MIWPFPDSPETISFSTKQVMTGTDPILLVTHDEPEGSWQFIGGPWEKGDLVTVCLRHAMELDQTVAELADLPRGWGAERAGAKEPWRRYPLPPEDEAQ